MATPSAQFSLTLRAELPREPGALGKMRDDLSMAYTPGVARICSAIAENPQKAFKYTIKANTVAVVSDGTAVLGLGDIGPAAAMPVMEGRAMLFKVSRAVARAVAEGAKRAGAVREPTTDTAELSIPW